MPDTSLEYTRTWLNEEDFPHLGFSRNWENPSDYPTYEPDESVVRADMQSLHDETKDYINNELIPAVVESNSTEAYRTAAETARAEAETARVEAEQSRAEAEQARENAETARAQAEATRALAETSRAEAETARVDAETARAAAEQNRVDSTNGIVAQATQQATAAAGSASAASGSASAAAVSASGAATSQSAALDSQNAAAASAAGAEQSRQAAADHATLANSWAVGGTGTRTGEDTNNARYWAEQAQQLAGGSHAASHATGGSDPITPEMINAVNKAGDTMTGSLYFAPPNCSTFGIVAQTHETNLMAYSDWNKRRFISIPADNMETDNPYYDRLRYVDMGAGVEYNILHTGNTNRTTLVSTETTPSTNNEINWTYA